jgi:predicted GNAT family N-acyltransferase
VNNLVIKKVENQNEFNQIMEIRKKVFVEEQNVDLNIEIDGFDKLAKHFIVILDNIPIGCARIRSNNIAKLERIAIIKEYRGSGYGKILTNYLIDYCKKNNYKEICIHSQIYVSDFYKKHGFIIRGKPFFEAEIKHIEMYMKI